MSMYDMTNRFLDPAFRRLVREVGRYLEAPMPAGTDPDEDQETVAEAAALLAAVVRLHQWQDDCPRCCDAGRTVFTVPYRALPNGVAVYCCDECGHRWRCSWGGDVDPWTPDDGPDDEGPGPGGPDWRPVPAAEAQA